MGAPRLIVLSAYAGAAYPIRPNGHASTSQRETSSRSVTGRRRPEIARGMTVSTMRETERDEVIAARGDASKPLAV
jgi:hypothetical protein